MKRVHRTGYYVWVGAEKRWFRSYESAARFFMLRLSQYGQQVVSLTDTDGNRVRVTDQGPEVERNPAGGIRAQARRLPSGQIQLKIPLKRGENALRKAHEVAKALGRKVVSVARAGAKRAMNPQLQKYVGGYYRVGEFFIGKAHIPMPKGQAWGIYTREGQVVGRAGSLKAAAEKAQSY